MEWFGFRLSHVCTYASITNFSYGAGLSQTGQFHVGFFSFIWRYVSASKHWKCEHVDALKNKLCFDKQTNFHRAVLEIFCQNESNLIQMEDQVYQLMIGHDYNVLCGIFEINFFEVADEIAVPSSYAKSCFTIWSKNSCVSLQDILVLFTWIDNDFN